MSEAQETDDLKVENILPLALKRLLDKQLIHVNARTITLGSTRLTLFDVRVSSLKNEDEVYTKNRDVWLNVPRGLCFVVSQGKIVFVLAGLRKFGYEADKGMRLVGEAEMKTMRKQQEVYMSKENGEAFHVAAFHLRGVDYLMFGSKNVHGVVRASSLSLEDDLKLYTETRYEFALDMARSFFVDEMARLNKFQKALTFLLKTGHTFVGESCRLESPHLVQYDTNQTLFFAATNYDYELHFDDTSSYQPKSLCALSPMIALTTFVELGLKPVSKCASVSTFDVEQRCQIRRDVEQAQNSEGAVVYCCVGDEGHVVHVYKLKSLEYVFWRAVREKMRQRASTKQLAQRLRELHVELVEHAALSQKALAFNAWCQVQHQQREKKEESKHNEWAEWLQLNWIRLMNDFGSVPESERAAVLKQHQDKEQQSHGLQLQLLPIAMPGSGKTTLLKAVLKMLGGEYVDQDMFNGDPKRYHQKVSQMSRNKSLMAIGLGKCNHTVKIRQDALRALQIQRVVFLPFVAGDYAETDVASLPSTIDDVMLKEARRRIDKRGKHHTTLHPSDKLDGILQGFVKSFQPLSADELKGTEFAVIPVNMLLTKEQMVVHVLRQLRDKQLLGSATADDDSLFNPARIRLAVEYAESEESKCQARASLSSGTSKGAGEAPKTTAYWGVELPLDQRQLVLDHPVIKSVLDQHAEFKINPVLHSTMLFVGHKKGVDESKCAEVQGWTVKLTILEVVHDGKAVALVLKKDFPCENETAHVTLALSPGTKPFYSNEMIGNKSGVTVRIVLDKPLVCSGVVKRHT